MTTQIWAQSTDPEMPDGLYWYIQRMSTPCMICDAQGDSVQLNKPCAELLGLDARSPTSLSEITRHLALPQHRATPINAATILHYIDQCTRRFSQELLLIRGPHAGTKVRLHLDITINQARQASGAVIVLSPITAPGSALNQSQDLAKDVMLIGPQDFHNAWTVNTLIDLGVNSVVHAYDFQNTLDLLTNIDTPTLCLVDMSMDDDFIEFIINAAQPIKQLELVALVNRRNEVRKELATPCQDQISKPAELPALRSLLARHLPSNKTGKAGS